MEELKQHDRIIRNKRTHDQIAEYIRNNPAKWSDDRFFKN